MGATGLRALFRIAELWDLSEEEQRNLLGGLARMTYYNWKHDAEAAKMRPDTIERLSYLIGIYKALQILLPVSDAMDAWVRKRNSACYRW